MNDDPQDVHNSPARDDAPAHDGPPANGPPVSGPPANGPPVSGPPVSGPPVSGAVDGAPVDGPAVSGPSASGPPVDGVPAKSGIELAREALAQAKADALKRGTLPGQNGKRKGTGRVVRVRDPGRGGDPKLFGAAIRDLMASRGWEQRAAVGGVFGNWAGIVGAELAEHTRPEHFEDGELTVTADSTTWATQLRLLSSTLVRRLNEELGHGTVRRVKVVGPSSGPRRPGAWRVR